MLRPSSKLLLICAILVGSAMPAAGEAPFFDGTFDDACKAAKEKNKIVMIDFYTTWCGPCKMLDRYTWPDAKVKHWLNERTIPMKVDAERNRELANRYRVRSYPTMVFIKPDGVEIARTVGFQQPTMFLNNANNLLKSVEPPAPGARPAASAASQTASKEAVSLTDLKVLDRMRLGREHVSAGKNAEALSEWLWCFDHGEEEGPGLTRIRLTSLLSEIAKLGDKYPPAREELGKRRDIAEKALMFGISLGASASTNPEAVARLSMTAMELAALSRTLNEPDRAIAVFEKLGDQGDMGRRMREAMFGDLLDPLLAARRYDDIVTCSGDVQAKVQERITQFEKSSMRGSGGGDRSRQDLDVYLRQRVSIDAGKYYEALLGAGKLNEAEELANRVLAFDASAMAYTVLVEHAVRAKAYVVAKALLSQAERSLHKGEIALVRKAAAGMPES